MIIKYNENITNYNVVVDYLSKNGDMQVLKLWRWWPNSGEARARCDKTKYGKGVVSKE